MWADWFVGRLNGYRLEAVHWLVNYDKSLLAWGKALFRIAGDHSYIQQMPLWIRSGFEPASIVGTWFRDRPAKNTHSFITCQGVSKLRRWLAQTQALRGTTALNRRASKRVHFSSQVDRMYSEIATSHSRDESCRSSRWNQRRTSAEPSFIILLYQRSLCVCT